MGQKRSDSMNSAAKMHNLQSMICPPHDQMGRDSACPLCTRTRLFAHRQDVGENEDKKAERG